MRILFETQFPGYELSAVTGYADLIKALDGDSFQLLVTDLQLGARNIAHLLPGILSRYPLVPVLVCSGSPEALYAPPLYRAGIMGYVSKLGREEELVRAIRDVLDGKVYMSETFKQRLRARPPELRAGNALELLSRRELQVAGLLRHGLRSSEIGHELNLRPSTVATYKVRIFTKLHIANVIELGELFTRYGSED